MITYGLGVCPQEHHICNALSSIPNIKTEKIKRFLLVIMLGSQLALKPCHLTNTFLLGTHIDMH